MLNHRVHPTSAFIEFKQEDVEQSVADRFEQQVSRYPDRIAIKGSSQKLTYAALNEAANRVARAILAQRGKKAEPVALLLGLDIPLIIAILGVLKAGKFYVPLDSAYPHARNLAILEDAQADLVVTDNRHLEPAVALGSASQLTDTQVLNVEEVASSFSAENPDLRLSPDSLAYILYTSGSTGKPKGVVHNHRNLLHCTLRYTNGLHISECDRLSLLSSLSFSAALFDTFGALLNGAALYPLDIREKGVDGLASWLQQNEITICRLVPTLFRQFVNTLRGGEEFLRLRAINLGGEPLLKKDVELYKKYFPDDCLLFNSFGSTEFNSACQYLLDKQTQTEGALVPIGYAVPDAEVLVLDEDGQELGFNCTGELAIKSVHLAVGYWNNPALTRAAFKSDPTDPVRRIYHTGDLGYVLPDGCIVHLGRKDFQVQIRGQRIEVAEIETALLQFSSVKEAAVVARNNQGEELVLVAYIVAEDWEVVTISKLQSFLRERLPEGMIPSIFMPLDALPLTSTGKLDRRALPEPNWSRSRLKARFVAPRTPTEVALASIWCEVLRLEQAGIHDNFFALGGHSLLATQVMSRLREELQVEVPLRDLFEAPTVALLAERVEAMRQTAIASPMTTIATMSLDNFDEGRL